MTVEANMVQHQAGGQFLQIGSGGTLNVHSSGTLSRSGTEIAATAAELNILDGVTATSSEINILEDVTATSSEVNILDGQVDGVTFTYNPTPATTGATDPISAIMQLVDANGDDIATAQFVTAYLSNELAGANLMTTAPSALSVSTGGVLFPTATTNPFFHLRSATTGNISIHVTYAAAATVYPGIIMPSGAIVMATTGLIWT